MPRLRATERRLSDPLPRTLYIDTDFFVGYFVNTDVHHESCRAFLTRLQAEASTTLYVSSLLWIEFAHVLASARLRNNLDPSLIDRYCLERWGQGAVRQRYLEAMIEGLENLPGQFDWAEIALDPAIRATATALMADYNLDGQDAVHLASALLAGVTNFASFDRRFRRVEGLVLWNNHVHLL